MNSRRSEEYTLPDRRETYLSHRHHIFSEHASSEHHSTLRNSPVEEVVGQRRQCLTGEWRRKLIFTGKRLATIHSVKLPLLDPLSQPETPPLCGFDSSSLFLLFLRLHSLKTTLQPRLKVRDNIESMWYMPMMTIKILDKHLAFLATNAAS